MGIFRPSREPRGPDPYLDLKIIILAIGAALGVAGMVTGRRWLVIAAIAVLGVGVLLRIVGRRR